MHFSTLDCCGHYFQVRRDNGVPAAPITMKSLWKSIVRVSHVPIIQADLRPDNIRRKFVHVCLFFVQTTPRLSKALQVTQVPIPTHGTIYAPIVTVAKPIQQT